ncbi:Rib/alpha-like domain-containing protein [Lactobacillus johnsonii]|uniref:Rib/alpha-like domain-containing protein n=1 Tax=Lactobacillus johnsonii TaxID=33959 RepID=UPI002B256E13|nr:Rib/alpha-like domain-containing protein [Lactobacillus johnsonii]
MLSKNNYKEKLRKMEPRKERFSIRKFSIGAASVLIGFFFMGIESQNVHADTLAPSQNKEVNKVKTPTVQNEKINLGKNTEVTLNNEKTSDITSKKNITSNDTNVQNNRERVADKNTVSLQKEKASDVTTGKNVTSNASNAQSSTDKTTNNQIALKQKQVTPSVAPSVNTTSNKSNVLSNKNTPQINNQVATNNKQVLATSNVAQVSNFADFTSALINKDINEIDFTNDISSSTGQSALNTSLLSGELSANSSNPFNSTYKDIARTLTINGQNHTLDLGNNYIAFYNQNVNSNFWNLTLKNMTLKANDNAGYSPFYFQNMGTNQQKNSSITFDNVNANLSKTQLFYGEDTPVILAGNTIIKDDLGKNGLGSLGAGYYNGIVCRSLTVTPDANVTMTVNTPDYAMNLWKPTPGAYVEENNNAVWLNSDDGNITIGKNAKFTINSTTQDMRGLASRAAGSTMKVEDGAQVVMNLANGHSTAIFAGNLDVGKNASIDITTMQDNNSEAASLPIAGATVVNSPLNWTNGVLNANGYHYAPISIGSFTFLQPLTHETHAINMEQGSTIRIHRGKANTITPLISFGSGSSNNNKTYTMTVGKGATLDLQDGAYGTVRAYTSYTMGLANSFPHAVEGPLNSQPTSFYPCGLITMFGVNGVNSLTFNSPKYVNLQRTDTTKTGSLIRLEGGTNEVNVNGSSINSIPTSAYDVKQTMLGKDSQNWQISQLTTYNGIGNTGLAFMPAGKKQNSVLSTNAETYTMGMSNGKVLMSPTQSGLNTYQYNNGVIAQGAPTQTGGNYVQSKDNLKSFLDNFNWWTPAQISFTSFDLDNSKYIPQTEGIEVTYYSTKPNVVRSTKPITFLNAEGQEVTNVPLLANGQAFTLQPSSSSSIATYALDTQTNDEIPEGTTINPQTGAISFIPTADEVGKTYNVPVLVRYADFSQMSVTIPVKVVAATDAQQYPAVGQDITTPAGIVPPAEKGIKNTAELPEGTKYSWENKPIIPNESGKTINSTVVVTYPDGSQDKVDVPITTTENEAEKFDNNNKDNALISGLTVTQGEKVAPSDALKAIKDPDANNVKSATFKETVNTDIVGKKNYPATVTFNDGSTTTVNIPVTVQAPITDADKYKPETQPIDVPAGGQLPDASSAIKNKDKMPIGTKYSWKVTPDLSTVGTHTGVITVEFPDGSSVDVMVKTYVDSGLAAKTDNKSITTSNTSYKLREENSNTHIAEAATIAKNKAAQTNKTLPQTDSKSEEIAGILGLAIAAIGSLLGLGLNRKKRQK